MNLHFFGLLLFLGLLFSACANYKVHYTPATQDWATTAQPRDQQVVYSIYLIGDAAGSGATMPPALSLLKEKLSREDSNNAVVFLGDQHSKKNIKKDENGQWLSSQLQFQLDAVKDFPGQIFFIPGHQKVKKQALSSLEKQAEFITTYLGRDNIWFPSPGCGGPEEIELRDDLVLILIDSQWYLQNWDGISGINANCEIKNRQVFRQEIGEAMKSNRDKNVLIALHHPPFTYGPRGGQYRLKDHLFPLTYLHRNLCLPLPVAGSVYNFFRANTGYQQDISNPRYRELATSLSEHAIRNGRFVFASAHDHSLQYIEQDSQVYIVSGSGAHTSAVRNGQGTQFSYARNGWAKMDYYEDGSSWVEFWVADKKIKQGKLVFRKKVSDSLPFRTQSIPTTIDSSLVNKTVKVPVSQERLARGPIWNFLFGKHYRKVYGTEVEVRALDLATYRGGVRPIKRGGGFQTNSLRLENAEEKQFTLRSVEKDATRTIPYPYNQSFAVDLVKDNFSASHPFAALVIPPLADAAWVYHTQPEIYFIPKQPGLGPFNPYFGNALFLLEERPDGKAWRKNAAFGYPKDIISTKKVLENIQEKQSARIDQRWVIRSRLFDMLVGDWDRHDDQWRWSLIKKGSGKYYRPIPRDRDQAFSQYDGFLMFFARNLAAPTKQWRPYRPDIKPVQWGNYNARHFDPSFTSQMEWVDWKREAKFIQAQITDQLIDSVFRQKWPDPVYRVSAPGIIKNLKERRNKLLDIAYRYYRFRAKKVDIVGTWQNELFEVVRQDNTHTLIRMYDEPDQQGKRALLYERTFLRSETKEINVFGLDGNDTIRMFGTPSQKPTIRLIGGPGKDVFLDQTTSSKRKKRNFIYDDKSSENVIQAGHSSKIKTSDNPILNIYDRKSVDHEYDFGNLLPSLRFNPDDGLLLGLQGNYTIFGFRKLPFASKHNYGLKYGIASKGFRFSYEGKFIDLWQNNWDVLIQAQAQTPFYAINFYGPGNDTPNPEVIDGRHPEYNRVQERRIEFKPLLAKLNLTGKWGFGPTYEWIQIDRTPGRFIDEIGDQLGLETFARKHFLGLRLSFQFANLDQETLPGRGLQFQAEAGWKTKIGDIDQHFPYIDSRIAFYQRIDQGANLVFAGQIGFQHRFTDQFEFFQAAYLGGTGSRANFRGIRRNRYAGKTAFFQNNDLRWKIIGSGNRTLPFSMGLLAGFDHGRVWLDKTSDQSDTWHYSYGGGVWISPFDRFLLNLSWFRSDDKWNAFTFQGDYFF